MCYSEIYDSKKLSSKKYKVTVVLNRSPGNLPGSEGVLRQVTDIW